MTEKTKMKIEKKSDFESQFESMYNIIVCERQIIDDIIMQTFKKESKNYEKIRDNI